MFNECTLLLIFCRYNTISIHLLNAMSDVLEDTEDCQIPSESDFIEKFRKIQEAKEAREDNPEFQGGVLEETEDCPVKTIVETIDLNLESPVSVLITKFSNKTQLIITETGKTSVFYQVSQIGQAAKLTYETSCLFGQETEESLGTIHILRQHLTGWVGSENGNFC